MYETFRSTNTLTDVSNNYTFVNFTSSHTDGSDTTELKTISLSDRNLTKDTAKSYEVTVNIFSENVEVYNHTVNTSATIGPLNFDCYSVTTAASDSNFNNTLTFSQAEGQSLPSWLTFNSTTANASISDPTALNSDSYTIANTYLGVTGNFVLNTNLTINVIEETSTTNNNTNNDEDHCLGTSSEALCGVLVAVIIIIALIPIIAIGAIVYCKCKKRPQGDRSRINDDENNVSHCESEVNRPTTNHQNQPQDAEDVNFNQIKDANNKA